jgi:hypothetical protein
MSEQMGEPQRTNETIKIEPDGNAGTGKYNLLNEKSHCMSCDQ